MDPVLLALLRDLTRDLWREWLGSATRGRWCWYCRRCGQMVYCNDAARRTPKRRRRLAAGRWHNPGCVVARAFVYLKAHGERPLIAVWNEHAGKGVDNGGGV